MFRQFLLPLSACLIIAGCATTAQYTSGKDYLKKYDAPAYQNASLIDQEIRGIAAIEPNLAFPARIGIARIENGQLTTVPADEASYWQNLTTDQDENYGDFVPVSPLIAAMVRGSDKDQTSAQHVVNHIRRGSARQHLDYVLIYEVQEMSGQESNALRLADLTILGLYVLPSRDVKIDASASAMLIDVRNGYPYGSATAFAEKSSAVTFAGRRKAKSKLSNKARLMAVSNLTGEVETFMAELKENMPAELEISLAAEAR